MVTSAFIKPPVPTCTFADNSGDCKALLSSWSFASQRASFCTSASDPGIRPQCTVDSSCPKTTRPEAAGVRCEVEGDDLTLLYWPVTTIGSLCGNLTTITPTPTAADGSPNTVVYKGATYTSPSAYYLFTASAWKSTSFVNKYWQWDVCGPTKAVTVPVNPTDVVSILPIRNRRRGYVYQAHSFDFANLNTVRATDYADLCRALGPKLYCETCCKTIMPDYVPRVTVPAGVLNLDEEWTACGANDKMKPVYVPLGVMERDATASFPREVDAMPTGDPDGV